MSSYSEYLSRKMQRTPKYIDTRPHRDAGHQTEVIKRLAASGVQEQKTTTFSGNLVLDGPSTRVIAPIKGGHSVQDTAVYTEYTAGQAVAQSSTLANTKAPQIQATCYTSTAMPDLNDRPQPEKDEKREAFEVRVDAWAKPIQMFLWSDKHKEAVKKCVAYYLKQGAFAVNANTVALLTLLGLDDE